MIVVLADDLSGAAEIGGVAWRYGLTAEIQHDFDASRDTDLIVVNSDSRALPLDVSAQRILGITRCCLEAKTERVFAKVDSVLRGHVLSDLTAAMTGLECQRTLLAPANPSLGRTIEQGFYRVDGTLLHETQFAHDPDYPATTASVTSLLRRRSPDPAANTQPLTTLTPGANLPAKGILVGDAACSADVGRWAKAIDSTTLPAGAAEFFAAFLRVQGCAERTIISPPVSHPSPHLFICGSASTATRKFCRQSKMDGVPLFTMPEALFVGSGQEDDKLLDAWAESTVRALRKSQRAIVAIDRPLAHTVGDVNRLTRLLSAVAARILADIDVAEIFVEGGATAAALIHGLGWSRLYVEEERAPGVVRTRPVERNGPRLTMKPGSYVWPERVRMLKSEFS